MLPLLRLISCGWLALAFLAAAPSWGQEPSATTSKPATVTYPDNTHGLENLAKDIIRAQKEGNEARARELAQSMALPDPAAWYQETFGPAIARDEGAKYAAGQKTLPAEILKFFFGAIQNDFTDVTAARFAEGCDDNAGESAFGTLQLRVQPVPLYELRLRNGDRFLRLFAVVYVDGAFRYAVGPKVPDHFPYGPNKTRNSPSGLPNSEDEDAKRIRMGANVQAARIVRKIVPEYPSIARSEHLEGRVRLHAVIAKDGSIAKLVVLSGYCSLAKSSMKAVSQWRYTPTLLNGEPVEVDTTIDVFFNLNH